MKLKTIYVDLDGVLYDFIGAVANIDGYSYQGRWFEYLLKNNFEYQPYIWDNFDKFVDSKVFLTGEMLPDAKYLLNELVTIAENCDIQLVLLGALSEKSNKHSDILEQKIEWLNYKRFMDAVSIADLFDDVIFVDGSKDKIKYAGPDSILIDDFDRTQTQYQEAGFPFILHRNAQSTIDQLNTIIDAGE